MGYIVLLGLGMMIVSQVAAHYRLTHWIPALHWFVFGLVLVSIGGLWIIAGFALELMNLIALVLSKE